MDGDVEWRVFGREWGSQEVDGEGVEMREEEGQMWEDRAGRSFGGGRAWWVGDCLRCCYSACRTRLDGSSHRVDSLGF